MPPNRSDILKVCQVLSEQEGLKVAMTESFKGAAIAAAGTFFGGLLLGPLGLAVGGITGSTFAYVNSKGKFKSVCDVISEDLTERQKQQLVDSVLRVIQGVSATDVVALLSVISTDPSLKLLAVKAIADFVSQELRLQLA